MLKTKVKPAAANKMSLSQDLYTTHAREPVFITTSTMGDVWLRRTTCFVAKACMPTRMPKTLSESSVAH